MTNRLYYDQTYLTDFTATVTAVSSQEGTVRVALSQSAFYPTSGGQPYDTGTLTAGEKVLQVTDVSVDRDGEVWHTVSGMLEAGETVQGHIDWERRFDHMQQHGGEHMLAGAVWTLYGGTTIGLHLGENESTIDVTMPDGSTRFTPEMIAALENDVNTHIWQDAPVRCFFPTEEELAALPLRKPPTVKENIRIVAFGDFEMVACGGTHPSTAGQIGLVKILSVTPSKGKARVAFVCGRRAFDHLARCFDTVQACNRQLSCLTEDLPRQVAVLKEKTVELEKANRVFLSQHYLRLLEEENGVLTLEDGDPQALQEAVSHYIRLPGRVALTCAGSRLVFACSSDVDRDMSMLIRSVARGGGKKDMASGSGDAEAVRKAAALLQEQA